MSCDEKKIDMPFIAVNNWVLKIDHITVFNYLVEYKVENTLVKFYGTWYELKMQLCNIQGKRRYFYLVLTYLPGFIQVLSGITQIYLGIEKVTTKNIPNYHEVKHNCIYSSQLVMKHIKECCPTYS